MAIDPQRGKFKSDRGKTAGGTNPGLNWRLELEAVLCKRSFERETGKLTLLRFASIDGLWRGRDYWTKVDW